MSYHRPLKPSILESRSLEATRRLLAVALSLVAWGLCTAGETALVQNVVMRSDQSLVSIKAGTIVELVSVDEKAATIRYHGQTGTVPLSSVSSVAIGSAGTMPAVPSESGVTPAVMIGSRAFFLGNEPDESSERLREYIPDGESLPHWRHMVSIRVIEGAVDPMAYLRGAEADAAKIERAHPGAHHSLQPDAATHDFILEFMSFAPPSYSMKYTQWNLMRATRSEGQGLVVYQYAARISTVPEQMAVDADRNTLPQEFAAATFEETTKRSKEHDARLQIVMDGKAETARPRPLSGNRYSVLVHYGLDFSGYMPNGIEIPAGVAPDGRVLCEAGVSCFLMDSNGVFMQVSGDSEDVRGTHDATFRGKGSFNFHTDWASPRGFTIWKPGTYTLTVDCFLFDQRGKRFTLSASHSVNIETADALSTPLVQPGHAAADGR
jgi:hypothetical protein